MGQDFLLGVPATRQENDERAAANRFETEVARFKCYRSSVNGITIGNRHVRKKVMPLNFPNTSRVYDESRRCIRFWGHDSAMEITFQIDEDALLRISPSQKTETALLHIFDLNRVRIERAAQSAYSRSRENYHRLSASDFK